MVTLRLLAFSFVCAAGSALALPGDTFRISAALDGSLADRHNFCGDVSRGGRYVGFSSAASNLILGDTNGGFDAYVRDRQLGTNIRISQFPNGSQSNLQSLFGTMSTDGRYIGFQAHDKLLPEDLLFVNDAYLYDRQLGQLELISKSTGGTSGNGNSFPSSISENGRYVAFMSSATNLVTGTTGDQQRAYLRDRISGTTKLVSVATNGQHLNFVQFVEISADGRFVAFQSYNRPYVRDLQTGITRMVARNSSGQPSASTTHYLDLSKNGRFVTFSSIGSDLVSGDTNDEVDTFVHDLKTGATTRVSVSTAGAQTDSEASDPQISEDGRLVVFYSHGTTLDAFGHTGGYAIFMHDRFTQETKRVSLKPDGTPAGGSCHDAYICPEGRFVTFRTDGFVFGSANQYEQIYLHELAAPNTLMSVTLARPVLAGANRTIGTVTVAQAGIGGPRVNLSETSASVAIPTHVQFADNSTTAAFNVIASPVSVIEVVTITAAYCDQAKTVNLTLIPLAPSAFQFTPSLVVGGNPVDARLVMNGVAGPGGETVNLSDNSAFAVTPPTAVVPPGSPQVNFTIATLPVTARKYVTVTASTAGGSKTGSFVIVP